MHLDVVQLLNFLFYSQNLIQWTHINRLNLSFGKLHVDLHVVSNQPVSDEIMVVLDGKMIKKLVFNLYRFIINRLYLGHLSVK